jgi:rhodanese-related sulfurtransferase
MAEIENILQSAHARAREKNLPYEGALTPSEAYALLDEMPGATLVDVRTHAEWDYVGTIPNSVRIEWQSYPTSQRNAHFLDELKQQVRQDVAVFFICRSGVRSHHAAAAAAAAGFRRSFNVLEGFQGDRNAEGHRDTVGGWRKAGLPWKQG